MPKLKQPLSMQAMAFEILLKSVVRCLNQLSAEGSLEELRQGVSIIKKRVFNYIPWHLLSDFSSRYLDEFSLNPGRVKLEMLMDIEIVRLRLKGPMVAYLDPQDVHRFRRLEELDLKYFPETVPISLKNFHLNDLTIFIYRQRCTDHDLKIIGRNCLMLQVLDVRGSRVTDEGLNALGPCSELRVVDILDCPVSYSGIDALLSIHKKIERFAHWDGTGDEKGCDVLSHLDSSVCPSISHFVFTNAEHGGPVDLKDIAAKFPNLTNFRIECIIVEDLFPLKSLTKLTTFEVHFVYQAFIDDIESMWGIIKELLTFIGVNITTLKFSCYDQGFFWDEDAMNFIYDSCPNVEHLAFDQGGGLVVIPPFPKLKELIPRVPIEFESIEILDNPALEFGKLSNLETLSLVDYLPEFQVIESIMLDDVKFPKLSVIKTNCLKDEDLMMIERIARNNNLDFQIENDSESNWYNEYRYRVSHDTDDDST